jgi:uroporphyrin-III C-methyltransferase
MKQHLISITGAGPGNPELLTMKAYQRITNAEVVIYDALPGDAILKLAPANATFIYAGKLANDGQDQLLRQEAIHHSMLLMAGQGKRIVRLKGGDPMIFGRGAEEIRFCRQNSLNYEVIPGISAAMAAASEFEIPLTERNKSPMVLLCTGTRTNGRFDHLPTIHSVLQSGATVSIYMGLSKLTELADALLGAGLSHQTHVNILSNVSQPGSEWIGGSLGRIARLVDRTKPVTPAMIIIGQHAKRIALPESREEPKQVVAGKFMVKPVEQGQNIFTNV